MDWHLDCVEELCLNPLHPGPCKGSGKGGRGGGGKKAAKKAPAKKAAKATGSSPAAQKAGKAGSAVGALVPGVDAAKFGASLAADIDAARGDQAKINEIFTNRALDLSRVLANSTAGGATPGHRRRLANILAPKINDALRSGNARPLQELLGKMGDNMTDDDIRALGGNSAAVEGVETFADKPAARTWRGMLAPVGKPTGDGRMFAPEALSNRDLPLPLRFQRQDGGGHGGAVVVGRILTIEYRDGDDPQAYATGDWLDPAITPEVREAQEWTRQGVIGPSVDLDDAVMEMVPVNQKAAAAEAAEAENCGCDGAHAVKELAEQPMLRLVTKGRISGATLVQIPAFAECHALELSDEGDEATMLAAANVGYAAGVPVSILSEDDDEDTDTGYFVQFSDDGEWATVVRDTGEVETVRAIRVDLAAPEDIETWTEALMASAAAATKAPPAAWFADPGLDGPTALQVTPDGRVFGHLAQWGTCHVGKPGCVTAPHSKTSYAYFHTGEVQTADGGVIDVGKITLGTGHADATDGFRAAADHYDHSGTAVAVVRAGEDAHGIWVAGALTANCDELKMAELRRSPLSGDWRRVGAHLELVAALAVNVPGFPVPRARTTAGRAMSLVASGALVEEYAKKKDDDGTVEERAEATFRKMMKKRKQYADDSDFFAQAEKEMASHRVQVAAALLAVLDD